jgi:hypothetical protein
MYAVKTRIKLAQCDRVLPESLAAAIVIILTAATYCQTGEKAISALGAEVANLGLVMSVIAQAAKPLTLNNGNAGLLSLQTNKRAYNKPRQFFKP